MWGHVHFFRQLGWQVVVVACQTPDKADARDSLGLDWPADVELHVTHRSPRWSQQEDPQAVSTVQALIDRCRPRVVWCEYADFAPLASSLDLGGAELWFRPHNFEAAHAFEKAVEPCPWRAWRGLRGLQGALLWGKALVQHTSQIAAVERRMLGLADRLFFISYGDRRAMTWLRRGTAPRDWAIPFMKRDAIPVKRGKTPLDVLYMGSNYTNNVNLSGARVLLDEVIPAVEAAMPGAFRFHLVGRGSKERLGHRSSDAIRVHGYVRDLRALLNDMDLACLPVRLGWGCKLKMVEALASGLPVVGAPQAFRGVPTARGAYCVCRTTRAYVTAFGELRDDDARARAGLGGRTAYRTWREAGQRALSDALADALSRG